MATIPYHEEIKKYVERTKERLKPGLIVLFGSAARGDFGLGSDIDILVISDRLPASFDQRSRLLFMLNETFAPIEPFGYTPDEFRRMLMARHATALSALFDGIVLHQETEFYTEVRKLFRRALKTVRKKPFGWIKLEPEVMSKSRSGSIRPRRTE